MLSPALRLLYLQLVASPVQHVGWGQHRLCEEDQCSGMVTANDAGLKVEHRLAHRESENET